MADYHTEEEKKGEANLMDQISDKIHGRDSSSSSSDSEDEKKPSLKAKVNRLFGREKPVHGVFGGGKRTCRCVSMEEQEGFRRSARTPPRIPEISIPKEPVLDFASALRIEINRAYATLRDIASGKDLKKFLSVIVGLWVLSFLGSCCDFLTLLYTITMLLFTVPLFYEKYEDKVDFYAEKALAELKKQYAVFDAKVLSKIPRGPLKDKKVNKHHL
ncbi:hypothetical protein DH2020_005605 [Rehmannia glutinosa]|uniref:Reticulon-like protein n=1 Tax=Rehmannia glutinosa TaxID=99300 RepID=A0ABR0XGL4_REHGL